MSGFIVKNFLLIYECRKPSYACNCKLAAFLTSWMSKTCVHHRRKKSADERSIKSFDCRANSREQVHEMQTVLQQRSVGFKVRRARHCRMSTTRDLKAIKLCKQSKRKSFFSRFIALNEFLPTFADTPDGMITFVTKDSLKWKDSWAGVKACMRWCAFFGLVQPYHRQ